MDIRSCLVATVVLFILMTGVWTAGAAENVTEMEKSMSDTLDIWREGRYEQLFEQLAHRGKTSRESFVKKMRESSTRPACCWQKMENFRVLNEKLTEATVYAKIGLEGTPNAAESATREFKMTHIEGVWRMQLADILSIAETGGKKSGKAKRHPKRSNPYHNL